MNPINTDSIAMHEFPPSDEISPPNEKVKIDFHQQRPPFTPVSYMSLSKFCGMSSKKYLMCGNKIAKYESRHMEGWRALLMISNTILCNKATWNKLGVLTVICFITMGLVFATDSQKSIGDSDVPGRVQFLLSFVLSAYVGLFIARYNNVRHNTLGVVWGGVENIALYSHQLFGVHFHSPGRKGAEARQLHATVERYSLAVFRLLFLAAQGEPNMAVLVEKNLLTLQETEVLTEAIPGTRALVVLGWLSRLFEKAGRLGYSNFILMNNAVGAISSVRGGVGATMGVLGTPLPFMYTHLVYWIVQILLLVIAISTGVNLAVFYDRRQNGDENYSYDDDNKHWPYSANRFYGNYFMQITAGNMIFAIFVEGLLFCCGEIENPMSTRSGALPDEAFFAFVHNNIKALTKGRESFDCLDVHQQTILPGSSIASNIYTHPMDNMASGPVMAGIPDGMDGGRNRPLHTISTRAAEHGDDYGGDGSVEAYRQALGSVSYEEVSTCVRALGEAYGKYADMLMMRGVVGSVFVALSEEEFRSDFEVVDKYHLRALQSTQATMRARAAAAPSDTGAACSGGGRDGHHSIVA